jgi:enoyl-CoA hydratase/carnithine racemase
VPDPTLAPGADPEAPSYIDLEREGPVATLVLNRPEKLNAWSWESARQLAAHADRLRFDDSVRVVVLRAEGRAFCAGVDLGMPEDRIDGRSAAEKIRNYYERFRWVHERFGVFSQLPQPVVVAIHGFCLGAGLEVAMMGDIRVAADDARFALPEPRVGVSIDAGGDMRLATEIGAGWTKLLAFTGRRIDAETALRIGIVQECVRRDELLGHTLARRGDRRKRSAGGAGNQANGEFPGGTRARGGAALRGRQCVGAVRLRRHDSRLPRDGQQAACRLRRQVSEVSA